MKTPDAPKANTERCCNCDKPVNVVGKEGDGYCSYACLIHIEGDDETMTDAPKRKKEIEALKSAIFGFVFAIVFLSILFSIIFGALKAIAVIGSIGLVIFIFGMVRYL